MYHNPKTRIEISHGLSHTFFVAEIPAEAPPQENDIYIHAVDFDRFIATVSAYRGIQRELQILLAEAAGEAFVKAMMAQQGETGVAVEKHECGCVQLGDAIIPCPQHAGGDA